MRTVLFYSLRCVLEKKCRKADKVHTSPIFRASLSHTKEGSGFVPSRENTIFPPKTSRAVLVRTLPPIQSVSGFFPGTKAPGASVNKVKNDWSHIFSPTVCFHGMVI